MLQDHVTSCVAANMFFTASYYPQPPNWLHMTILLDSMFNHILWFTTFLKPPAFQFMLVANRIPKVKATYYCSFHSLNLAD